MIGIVARDIGVGPRTPPYKITGRSGCLVDPEKSSRRVTNTKIGGWSPAKPHFHLSHDNEDYELSHNITPYSRHMTTYLCHYPYVPSDQHVDTLPIGLHLICGHNPPPAPFTLFQLNEYPPRRIPRG